jgi:hypothetical protein
VRRSHAGACSKTVPGFDAFQPGAAVAAGDRFNQSRTKPLRIDPRRDNFEAMVSVLHLTKGVIMTWQTPDGDRVLCGAEGELVREALAVMVDQTADNLQSDERLFSFGVAAFDAVTPTEQLAVIKDIAEHLLTETAGPLELTSLNEAGVYAIFRSLLTQIEIEIDVSRMEPLDDDDPEWLVYWRSLTLRAYRQCLPEGLEDEEFNEQEFEEFEEEGDAVPLDEHCEDLQRWESITESLADRLLWDRDFEMADAILDIDPGKAEILKQLLGIEHQYYSSVSADVRPVDVEQSLAAIRRLTHEKPR